MDTIIVYKTGSDTKVLRGEVRNVHDYHVQNTMMFNTSCHYK